MAHTIIITNNAEVIEQLLNDAAAEAHRRPTDSRMTAEDAAAMLHPQHPTVTEADERALIEAIESLPGGRIVAEDGDALTVEHRGTEANPTAAQLHALRRAAARCDAAITSSQMLTRLIIAKR